MFSSVCRSNVDSIVKREEDDCFNELVILDKDVFLLQIISPSLLLSLEN